jgi:putative ABC transport system permease protein
MTTTALLLRNLAYHWRGNLAVLLGVAVGTAVLTGALLVGDSLRGSLREKALTQLNGVESVLAGGRFVREELASEIGNTVTPAVLLRATARAEGRQAGRVSVVGVPAGFPVGLPALSDGAEAVLSANLADELGVSTGGTITLQLQKVAAVPRESLLGRRTAADLGNELPLTVKAVLPAGSAAGSFSVAPSPEAPRNLFVPLRWLQRAIAQPGLVNAMLAAAPAAELQPKLAEALTLDDWGLSLTTPAQRAEQAFRRAHPGEGTTLTRAEVPKLAGVIAQAAGPEPDGSLPADRLMQWYNRHPYLNLTARELLLEPAVVAAARAAAADTGLRPAETLVYLANEITHDRRSIPYSLVAAVDPALPAPLGPFLPEGVESLADDEIVLVDWKQSPLKVKAGEPVTLRYYLPEIEGRLRTGEHTFRLKGFLPLDGVAADPDLTPEFPGVSDQLDMKSWDPPFPVDSGKIQARDDRFWKEFRATPKAYVSLAAGQKLWGSSRFGNVTSLRLAPARPGTPSPTELEQSAVAFRQALRQRLDPEKQGLSFRDVRAAALQASAGSTDFGMLFVGFSFFLIAAAVLLVGLLVRLNLDRRAPELGVLLATGFSVGKLRRLLLSENLILAVIGGLIGLLAALAYAAAMIGLLGRLWPGGTAASFLRLHPGGTSLVVGLAASLAVCLLAAWWAVRALGRVPPRALLAGETLPPPDPTVRRRVRWGRWLAVGSLAGALVVLWLGRSATDHMAQAGAFFGSGALLLTASLSAAGAWLTRDRHTLVSGRGPLAIVRLGMRNAVRNPARSLLTAGLLASASFVLVAVEAFRRSPEEGFLEKTGGSGGFPLIAEADLPVFQNLDTDEGKAELFDGLQKRFQAQAAGGGPPAAERLADAEKRLDGVTFFPLRLRAGQDASCLNLYQVTRPTLLSVPDTLIDRGGFHWAGTVTATPEERANPWLLLRQPQPGGAVPVVGDANSLTYILHKGVGDTLETTDEAGNPVTLRVVAALADSVFQGQLLISEPDFLRLYPRQEGYSQFLIAAPPGDADAVSGLLEEGLAAHGIDVEATPKRLAAYLAVENTYLSTFQVLGGFGLLLGALGLAVVLLRNVWERRAELALLRALGYRTRTLGWLVLVENGMLLALGLGAGVGSAALAVAPHLSGGPDAAVWLRLAGLLLLVVLTGLVAGGAAVASSLRAPLVPALRRE